MIDLLSDNLSPFSATVIADRLIAENVVRLYWEPAHTRDCEICEEETTVSHPSPMLSDQAICDQGSYSKPGRATVVLSVAILVPVG